MSILPFNIADQLILSTLSYVNFTPFMDGGERLTFKEAAIRILNADFRAENFRVKNDYELLKAVLTSPRFSSLEFSDVEDHFDTGLRQFFAFTVHLPDEKLIVFRGTDNTVTGWKEDFDMAYEDEVPSQHDALAYLSRIAEKYQGDLSITGHSKGGNLAVYAAANSEDGIKHRIRAVYNNDGPGFNEHNRTHENLASIKDRVITIVPSSSFIGVLMDHSDDYRIVASSARLIMQHDPYSWLFDGPDFKYVRKRSNESLLFERVIASWLKNASKGDREIFVDAIYKCLSSTGIDQFAGKNFEIIFRAPEVIKSYRALPEKEKTIMKKVVVKLIQATRSNLLDVKT